MYECRHGAYIRVHLLQLVFAHYVENVSPVGHIANIADGNNLAIRDTTNGRRSGDERGDCAITSAGVPAIPLRDRTRSGTGIGVG